MLVTDRMHSFSRPENFVNNAKALPSYPIQRQKDNERLFCCDVIHCHIFSRYFSVTLNLFRANYCLLRSLCDVGVRAVPHKKLFPYSFRIVTRYNIVKAKCYNIVAQNYGDLRIQ